MLSPGTMGAFASASAQPEVGRRPVAPLEDAPPEAETAVAAPAPTLVGRASAASSPLDSIAVPAFETVDDMFLQYRSGDRAARAAERNVLTTK